ncbi:uncharacterized protein LOC119987805 [Tripterygium wilfordii]|uniref:uncharacterized protein LOC119987805 n=1 Tax=Tripterygium wilfordii TaxID=458696 RepID=UPI0018F802FA|nr:uncharacterized protein LOC119987805 [Tripterygium wilfordii]
MKHEALPDQDPYVIIPIFNIVLLSGKYNYPITITSNLTKLEFLPLDVSGENYLSWYDDVETHFVASNLSKTIIDGSHESPQDRAKALIFLRRHLHEELKSEYLSIKNPLDLWKNLKERYEHQKCVILLNTQFQWTNMRLQDFKTVREYNYAMFRITTRLKLYGITITENDMLKKTYTTFHPSNMLLMQQYRGKQFTKYAELISCLLLTEQNNELLLKNHQSRPTEAVPFPEANTVMYNGCGSGRGRGGRRGRGRSHWHYHYDCGNFSNTHNALNHQKKFDKFESKQSNPKDLPNKFQKDKEDICYKCGGSGIGHESIKGKGKMVESNFAGKMVESNCAYFNNENELNDLTHLDMAYFFDNAEENVDLLVGDGSMQMD